MINILNCALALGIASCVAIYPSVVKSDSSIKAINYSNISIRTNNLGFVGLTTNTDYSTSFNISYIANADQYVNRLDSLAEWNNLGEQLYFSIGSSNLTEDTLLYFSSDYAESNYLLEDGGITSHCYIYLNSNSLYNKDSLQFDFNLNITTFSHTSILDIYQLRVSYNSNFVYQSDVVIDNVSFYKYIVTPSVLDNSFIVSTSWDSLYSYTGSNAYNYHLISWSVNFQAVSSDATARQDAYNQGFNAGKEVGYQNGLQAGATAHGLFFSIADTPIVMLKSLFNFDFFGVNFFVIMMSLLTLLLVLFIIKKIK